jgi:antitoxin CptB
MQLLDERALSKLRWRCRRGLLENDLFIERFFNRYPQLTAPQGEAMTRLMDLSDNDLLDLFLARKQPQDTSSELDHPEVHALLALLRQPPQNPPQIQGALHDPL